MYSCSTLSFRDGKICHVQEPSIIIVNYYNEYIHIVCVCDRESVCVCFLEHKCLSFLQSLDDHSHMVFVQSNLAEMMELLSEHGV